MINNTARLDVFGTFAQFITTTWSPQSCFHANIGLCRPCKIAEHFCAICTGCCHVASKRYQLRAKDVAKAEALDIPAPGTGIQTLKMFRILMKAPQHFRSHLKYSFGFDQRTAQQGPLK